MLKVNSKCHFLCKTKLRKMFSNFAGKNKHCLSARRLIVFLLKFKLLVMKNVSQISECTFSYGENCKYPCSIHCINQTCERFNGSCLYSCKDGEKCNGIFLGIKCLFFSNEIHCHIKSKVLIMIIVLNDTLYLLKMLHTF